MSTTSPLHRTIGLPSATAMVVGTIIGASIFVQPSAVTARVPSVPGVLAAWLAAGALTMAGALVAAELASAYPRTGGVYVFLREAYSPAAGFLWGWAMLWVMHSGIVAAIATVAARYVAQLVPLAPFGVRAVAVGFILGLSAVNYVGVREGSRLQTVLTLAKVAAVVALVAVLFGAGSREPVPPPDNPVPLTAHGLLLAVGAGLFAFGGWHMVTYAAGETVDAARTIPRALVLGTLIVTACYLGLNAGYLHVLPLGTVADSRSVAADATRAVLGAGAAKAVAAVVVMSALGALNGVILAGPRVYYAMAQDGLLFGWLGAVHPVRRTPHRAILVQAAWSSVLVATGSYERLFGRVVYTEWIFFALMAAGLVLLRRRQAYRSAYRLPGGSLTPLLFAAAAAAVAVNQVTAAPLDSAIGLALVASGLPVYLIWVARRPQRRTA